MKNKDVNLRKIRARLSAAKGSHGWMSKTDCLWLYKCNDKDQIFETALLKFFISYKECSREIKKLSEDGYRLFYSLGNHNRSSVDFILTILE